MFQIFYIVEHYTHIYVRVCVRACETVSAEVSFCGIISNFRRISSFKSDHNIFNIVFLLQLLIFYFQLFIELNIICYQLNQSEVFKMGFSLIFSCICYKHLENQHLTYICQQVTYKENSKLGYYDSLPQIWTLIDNETKLCRQNLHG